MVLGVHQQMLGACHQRARSHSTPQSHLSGRWVGNASLTDSYSKDMLFAAASCQVKQLQLVSAYNVDTRAASVASACICRCPSAASSSYPGCAASHPSGHTPMCIAPGLWQFHTWHSSAQSITLLHIAPRRAIMSHHIAPGLHLREMHLISPTSPAWQSPHPPYPSTMALISKVQLGTCSIKSTIFPAKVHEDMQTPLSVPCTNPTCPSPIALNCPTKLSLDLKRPLCCPSQACSFRGRPAGAARGQRGCCGGVGGSLHRPETGAAGCTGSCGGAGSGQHVNAGQRATCLHGRAGAPATHRVACMMHACLGHTCR